MSLVDKDRQWFKSRVGLGVQETHRDLAMCSHVVYAEGTECMVVSDTWQVIASAPPPPRQPACACGRLCERCRNSGGLLHETRADGRRRPCGLIASLRDSIMSLPCTQHLFCCWPSPVVGARHMLSTANTREWPRSRLERDSSFFLESPVLVA